MRVLADHHFVPNRITNPRYKRSCDVCSRVPEAHPAPRERHSGVEDRFVHDALELAQRHGWAVTPAWTRAVFERLEMGEREYGNRALGRDNLPDILEEAPDLGTYPVLELQRLLLDKDENVEEDRLDLLAVAAHGAAAHWHLHRIQRRRAGLD